MGLFKKKVEKVEIEFDTDRYKPVIKCSICNGEQVAGFKHKLTGEFSEVMLIKNQNDLDYFKNRYHIESVTKEY